MLSLDLFSSRFEKELHEGAVDNLEARRIDDLNMRMLELLDRAKEPAYKKNPAALAGLKKQFQKIKAERDSYFKINPATGMNSDRTLGTTKGKLDEVDPTQRPPAKGLLKNKDLITPQQRVAGATPAKPGMMGAVKDVVGGIKRFVKGEPDQGPTYEATTKKKDSNKNNEVQNLAVQRYLTKVRREHPAAYSDLEAISKHEIEKEKQTQSNINRLQQTQKTTLAKVSQDDQVDQAQSKIIKDLENQVDTLSARVQNIQPTGAAPVTTPTPSAVTPIPSIPVSVPTQPTKTVAKEPVQPPIQQPGTISSEPVAKLPKKDKNILRRVRGIQKRLEKRVDQYADKKSADTAQKIQDLQAKLDAETAKLSNQGQDAAQQSSNVIDITDRLKAAGLDFPKTGTFGEAESPVIGNMVQQIEKQPGLTMSAKETYDRNMKAFSDAYQKTRGTKLYYGGSSGVPLPFSDMDALVSVITAFPAEQKLKIWSQLFTDPNYLKGFLDQYVRQRGLIEGDVIPMAQQRQAPAQLKAYNQALEIMRSARDPNVSPTKIDTMKQMLFKDFGTRIQKHPSGYYYITFQNRPIKLPDPTTFGLEEHGGGIGPKQRWQDLMPEQTNSKDDDWYDDADEYGMPGNEFDEDDRLRDGDYVRDSQDGESGEVFRMSGDPSERRVRILDRDGRGWYIEPSRLTRVDPADPDVQRYFGKKRVRDMDESDIADQVKQVFKDKAGKPVGEIGIDPESSPGNGEWYVHHYATGYSVVGFDSAAEAKRELLYVNKHPDAVEGHPSTKEQGVAEAANVNPEFINVQVTKILAGEARRMTNAPMAQLLAPVMKQYGLTLQQIDAMVPGGLKKAAAGYGIMMKEGWSDAVVARRTGTPRTPYSVYIKGKKWRDFESDDHAEAVANKLRAKFKADGRDPSVITVAPTDMSEAIVASGPSKPLDDRAVRKLVWDTMKINADTGEQAVQRALAVLAKKPQSRMVQDLQDKFQNLADRLAQDITEDQDTSAVEQAIVRRIMIAHLDLLKQYGPEKVMQAAEEVAYNVGDVDEIGTSDVSAYVQQVKQILGATP